MRKSILVEVTNKCNLRCKHCYNNQYLNNKDINEELFFVNINILKEKGFNHVHFLGGEPLMNKKLPSYISKLKELDFSVTINTNATLIDDQFIKNVIPMVEQLSFSLDGVTAKENDEIRNKGTFDKVIKNIRKINSFKTELLLNYVITNHNYKDIYKIIDIADKMSVEHINLLWFYEVESNHKYLPDEKQYDCIFDELEKLLLYSEKNEKININFDLAPKVLDYFRKIGLIREFVNKNNCKCFAESTNIYMNTNGEIYPCHPFHEKFGFSYNLQKGNYLEYINSIKNVLDKKISKNDECDDCIFFEKCLACPIENNNQKLCKYIDKRIYNIIAHFTKNDTRFNLNADFQLIFGNKIVNKKSKKIISVSDEVSGIIKGEYDVRKITGNLWMEFYGLVRRGIINERLSQINTDGF